MACMGVFPSLKSKKEKKINSVPARACSQQNNANGSWENKSAGSNFGENRALGIFARKPMKNKNCKMCLHSTFLNMLQTCQKMNDEKNRLKLFYWEFKKKNFFKFF
jgi:hypothetical protein